LPVDDEVSQLKVKKKKLEKKQQQAEKMISEGTERLATALKNSKIEDAVPAQALLEAGNKMLKDCRHELEPLDQYGSHLPNKMLCPTLISVNFGILTYYILYFSCEVGYLF